MPEQPLSATDVAQQLAAALDSRGQEYALGGAIALGYWSEPRGTVDVDLTLFLPSDKPSQCIWCLQEIGCEVDSPAALESLREHGCCRVTYRGVRVDAFLPIISFYETARQMLRSQSTNLDHVWVRRELVELYGQRDPRIAQWDELVSEMEQP